MRAQRLRACAPELKGKPLCYRPIFAGSGTLCFLWIGRGEATLASRPGYKRHPGHLVELEHGPPRVQIIFDGKIVADGTDVTVGDR